MSHPLTRPRINSMERHLSHMPAPWTVDRSPDGRSGTHIRCAHVMDGAVKGVSVARLTEGKMDDAHLIAAAPEMLEALRRIANLAEHPLPEVAQRNAGAFAAVAIAKAEGRAA